MKIKLGVSYYRHLMQVRLQLMNNYKMNYTHINELNKEIVPDPLTGYFQTIYYNNDGTFFMSIPHKGIKLPKGYIPPKYNEIKNEDGSYTFELI